MSSENAPAYTIAANEDVIKAIVSLPEMIPDTVFLGLSYNLRPNILKV